MSQLLELVLQLCRQEMSDVAFDVWLSDLQIMGLDGSQVQLQTSTPLKLSVIHEGYFALLQEKFETILGFPVTLQLSSQYTEEDIALAQEMGIDVREAANCRTRGIRPEAPKKELETVIEEGDYDYTFDTFIVGSSNKFAHAASIAVAANPAKAYNPLFIYGNSGLGKTHLLHAIQREIKRSHENFNILYIKGDEFANELIEAIKNKTNVAFREKYRYADVLLVDDIQFIGGKDSTQEEFFHTFNTLYESRKQIVLASDRPPKEIKTLEDRLRTRFESGLLADIQIPDFETRIAIIRRKAQLMSLELPQDVAEYMANSLKTNIRQLEGVVKKIKFQKDIQNIEPSIFSVQSTIKDILNDNVSIPLTVDRIINEVARTFDVTSADICSNKRNAQISSARQAAMFIVRDITAMSTTSIGDKFGGRDHSTVVYAIKQAEKNMEADHRFKATVEDIIKNIRSS